MSIVLNQLMNIVEEYLSFYFNEKVKVSRAKTLDGGCINNVSKLETNIGEFFFKWNDNCNSDMFLREAESLRELQKASADVLKIPKVFCVKEVDSTPGFLVLEYLKPNSSSSASDEKLGRGLALLHSYANEKFGFYSNNYCGATIQCNNWKANWVNFFRENRLRFLLDLIQQKRPLPIAELKIYDRLLDKIEYLLPVHSSPVLIHGDLWSGNYMNTVSGPVLIDPAAYFADREMEFAIITMFGGFSQTFFGAYNEINPLPNDWQSRNRLYQLYHVLNHYYLFGQSYQSQALSIARYFV